MKRAPDKTLEHDALLRRERFPVAVVVVVHDDISLMRATLEEVAIVVEFIVSGNNCTCWRAVGGGGYICRRAQGEGYHPFRSISKGPSCRRLLPIGIHECAMSGKVRSRKSTGPENAAMCRVPNAVSSPLPSYNHRGFGHLPTLVYWKFFRVKRVFLPTPAHYSHSLAHDPSNIARRRQPNTMARECEGHGPDLGPAQWHASGCRLSYPRQGGQRAAPLWRILLWTNRSTPEHILLGFLPCAYPKRFSCSKSCGSWAKAVRI